MSEELDIPNALDQVGIMVRDIAIKNCPFDHGDLSASINYRVIGNVVEIYSDNDHAAAMEFGEPPHEIRGAEEEALKQWAKRKGANPYRIIAYIRKHGIVVGSVNKPLHVTSYARNSYRPFLRPALWNHIPEIKKKFEESL